LATTADFSFIDLTKKITASRVATSRPGRC